MYNELYHSGIKMQKWGQRRFQYHDGTYTPLGKARRRKGGATYTAPSNASINTQARATTVSTTNSSGEKNSTALKYKKISDLTDAELKDVKNRVQTENEYFKELATNSQYTKAKSKVSVLLSKGKTIADAVDSAGKSSGKLIKFATDLPETFELAKIAIDNVKSVANDIANGNFKPDPAKLEAIRKAKKEAAKK